MFEILRIKATIPIRPKCFLHQFAVDFQIVEFTCRNG